MRRKVAVTCLLLALLTWAAFAPVLWNGFVNFDDDAYVTENAIVARGLSAEGLRWAFTVFHSSNWHPLTWISHMVDCQMFGLRAWGHHLSSVLLHTLAAILLFLMLRELTGAQWRSAFVSAVFAVHPLRVESVAWVAERKDVLSAIFFFLTLWAYVRYVRKSEAETQKEEGKKVEAQAAPSNNFRLSPSAFSLSFWPVVAFFLMGLMSKPMLVTVPFVLLLLDYWPLGRMDGLAFGIGAGLRRDAKQVRRALGLLCEKLPLFVLSAISCVITVLAQKNVIAPLDQLALASRIGNASVAYVVYLGQTVWPVQLTVLYPLYSQGSPWWQVLAALVLLVALTAAAFACRRKQPAALVGWFWYLGMLIPVINIMQVGSQAHADRYTYLPQIGLLIACAWMASDWAGQRRGRQVALAAFAGVVLLVLAATTRQQTLYWRDSMVLWTRALNLTRNNLLAHNNLGNALLQDGQPTEAIAHYREALRINPAYADAHNNLGTALLQRGRIAEAIMEYHEALRLKPWDSKTHFNLGNALIAQGEIAEAITRYGEALRIDPNHVDARSNLGSALINQGQVAEGTAQLREVLRKNPAHTEARSNLGTVLLNQGQVAEAVAHFREALRIDPSYTPAQYNLAVGLSLLGQSREALEQMEKALQIEPDNISFQNQLAWMLATVPEVSLRNGPRAVELAGRANAATGGNDPVALRTLAAAYAQTGEFSLAIQTAQRALRITEERSQSAQVDSLRRDLDIYKAGRALETNQ